MNVLIVDAHPEPRSFNGALKDRAVDVLSAAGHAVTVSDLYAMGFDPVTGPDDFEGERADPEVLSIPREQTRAVETGTLAPDILAEQRKLAVCDLLILRFPVRWFGMPAILKGWADRVFTRGFADLPGRKDDTGMFKGKLALVSATTGTSADACAPDGIDGDTLSVLWPVRFGWVVLESERTVWAVRFGYAQSELIGRSSWDGFARAVPHDPLDLDPRSRGPLSGRHGHHVRDQP